MSETDDIPKSADDYLNKNGGGIILIAFVPCLFMIVVTGLKFGLIQYDSVGNIVKSIFGVIMAMFVSCISIAVTASHVLFYKMKNDSSTNSSAKNNSMHQIVSDTDRRQRLQAEADERERQRREQAAADERAFWNSPEGRRLRAERELAEIRRREREEAAEMARRIAEEEHKRQQEALKTLKDL